MGLEGCGDPTIGSLERRWYCTTAKRRIVFAKRLRDTKYYTTGYNSIEKDISVISIVEDSKPRESEELPISRSGNSRLWDVKSRAHKLEKLHQKKANELNSPDEFDENIDGPRVLESLDSSKEEKLSEDKKDIFISKKSGKTKLAELDELKPLTDIKDASMKLILPETNSSLQRQSGMLESERAYEDTYQRPLNFSLPEDTEKNNKTWLAPVQTSTAKPSIWETRRRLRLSHLSGGGAAAAVAMVAVGAVMLVLGPAVIVLRALDERRQERRFLKLSARDDLPPTYEQATLMDEAPRYSSLSLNTILGPPPPPSPTPARVQLV
ncbi:hypothetical protein G9C98_002015 [Cotesia typhae]|uniref:Uncharacterized protein n=1 Tax=Cotesia typhae TaxID=2053667 RepID=A0A8J5UTA2_9HYME|nr:hypothetical protein G9C98_002015 [Cotesia typhae]